MKSQIFQWVLITLTCYRAQRLFVTDDVYPARTWRAFLTNKAAPSRGKSGFHFWVELHELFTCPHCMGIWITSLAYFIICHFHHLSVTIPFFQAIATMGIISVLADHGRDGE